MVFVDTHCHLNLPAYQEDLEEVVQLAIDNHVEKIIIPATDLLSSQEIVSLCDDYPPIFGAVGVHPESCGTYTPTLRSIIKELLTHPKVVAIGEIGLDCFHRRDNIDEQKDVFVAMLEMAVEFDKPVIIHSREALQQVVEIIQEINKQHRSSLIKGVFHSFEGDLDEAQSLTALGFCVGAGGPITYKNATKKHEVFSKIDLSKIVLETDGPYLTPQSHRGKRNLPSYIPEIAAKLAELQKCDVSEIAAVTTKNARDLFRLD